MKTLNQCLSNLFLVIIFSALILGCAPKEKEEIPVSYFITKLGNDTLAVESFTIDSNRVTAAVLLRTPFTSRRAYEFESTESGELVSYTAEFFNSQADTIFRTESAFWNGDSLHVKINDRERNIAIEKNVLPFIDMVHWPFDLMISRAPIGGPVSQPLFSGFRGFTFKIDRQSADSAVVTHPTRGSMGVSTSSDGLLMNLEASLTTRALSVTRVNDLDLGTIETSFVNAEKAGKRFGALSGRGSDSTTMAGTTFLLDFGTPVKRGRDIWGNLVRYGKLWRTGANRATHFTTSSDVVIGDLEVPAGQYTFFTILEENEGILIINKQTGQNGQTYDEANDLGRVVLTTQPLENEVEVFRIAVDSQEDGKGLLRLQWDNKEYVVGIKIN